METMTLEQAMGYILNILIMVVGGLAVVGYRILLRKIKDKYDIDVVIDEEVKIAEETVMGISTGSVKKKRVLEKVEEHLKNEGASLLKRLVIRKLGGIGGSIDKAAKRFFK